MGNTDVVGTDKGSGDGAAGAEPFQHHPPLPKGTPENFTEEAALDDGTRLWRRVLCPRDPAPSPRGLVVFFHGIHEHAARYRHVMSLLANAGFEVVAQDMPAHGGSNPGEAGQRGHVDFAKVLEVSLDFVLRLRKETPSRRCLPLFLWGQSWGGLLSTALALELQNAKEPYSGLILTSAAIGVPPMSLSLRVKAALGPLLECMVPEGKLIPCAPSEKMSSQAVERERYMRDPLNCPGNLSVKTGLSTARGMAIVDRLAEELAMPILAVHGEKDDVCYGPAVRGLLEKAKKSSPQTRFEEIPQGWHTLFHEPQWHDLAIIIIKWLEERLAS